MRGSRAAAAALLACCLLPSAGHAAPAVEYANDEVVRATLDPSGLPTSSTLISRVTAPPGAQRVVQDPASTINVRYLDRRGAPETAAGAVLLEVGGRSASTVLTEAAFDKPLPVALHAEYRLDGRVVDPGEVVGATGTLEIVYTATNTTAELRTITTTGGDARELPVFVPFGGALTVTVPRSMSVVDPDRAAESVDAGGATVLRYDLLLAPPAGRFQETFRIRLVADSPAATPAVTMVVAPLTGAQNPALGFAQGLVGQSAETSAELAAGLGQLDAGTAALAGGAAELAAGAAALAAGQAQFGDALATGAAGAQGAVDAASALAGGLQQLAAGLAVLGGSAGLPAAAIGAEQLRGGAAFLAGIVGSSADGPWRPEIRWPTALPPLPPGPEDLPEWAAILGELPALVQELGFEPDGRPRDGLCDLDRAGDGRLDNPVTDLDCVPTLVQSLRLLATGAGGAGQVAEQIPPLLADAGGEAATAGAAAAAAAASGSAAAAATTALADEVCGPTPVLNPAQCASLAAVEAAAGAAAASATDAGAAIDRAVPLAAEAAARAAGLAAGLPVLAVLIGGTGELAARVGDGLSATGQPPGLVQGLDQLMVALRQAAGASAALSGGAAAAAAGAGQLADGSSALASGLRQAVVGADALAGGADQLRFGADALAGGADQLQQGTGQALEGVIDGAAEAALAAAYLRAVDDRAAEGLPYGPPEGAIGNAAYLLEMPATTPEGNVLTWGLAAILALLAGGFARVLLGRGTGGAPN